MENMRSFFVKTYEGFYPMICGSEHQRFIKNNEIVFSKKFCRTIISNTLPFLLYFHVHLINFLELAELFITKSNASGQFLEK